jgi:hypothetical protein
MKAILAALATIYYYRKEAMKIPCQNRQILDKKKEPFSGSLWNYLTVRRFFESSLENTPAEQECD